MAAPQGWSPLPRLRGRAALQHRGRSAAPPAGARSRQGPPRRQWRGCAQPRHTRGGGRGLPRPLRHRPAEGRRGGEGPGGAAPPHSGSAARAVRQPRCSPLLPHPASCPGGSAAGNGVQGSAGGGRARPASPQCCRDAWDGPVRSSQKVKNERRGPCGAASRPLPGCAATALGRAGVSPRVGAPVGAAPPARPRGFVTPYLTPRSPAGVGSAALTARPAPAQPAGCWCRAGGHPGDTRLSSPAPSTAQPRPGLPRGRWRLCWKTGQIGV